jgi:uncharacterized membrane protein (TIGR02234 family)
VLTLLATGGLAFFAASRTWASTTIKTPGLPFDKVAITGADAYPAVPALALVVAASAVAILATGPRVRRAIGVLVVVVSLVAMWLMLDGNHALESAIADVTKKSPAYTETSKLGSDLRTVWDLVTLGALGLAAALGGLVVGLAAAWPTMGSRYESLAGQAKDARTEDELWAALDEGRDPTE